MSNSRPLAYDRVNLFGPIAVNLLATGDADLLVLNDQDTKFFPTSIVLETAYARGTTATDPIVIVDNGPLAKTSQLHSPSLTLLITKAATILLRLPLTLTLSLALANSVCSNQLLVLVKLPQLVPVLRALLQSLLLPFMVLPRATQSRLAA